MTEHGFGGRRVVSFESRRAAEMASLIERHGGVPVSAPALREIALSPSDVDAATPLATRPGAWPACSPIVFAEGVRARRYDAVVLMTGVGTRALADAVAPILSRSELAAALDCASVIARGPKPAAALRELGVARFARVDEPNTWREVLRALMAAWPLAGRRIAVQEYGAPSTELYQALEQRGASVQPVSVYQWALPEDTLPLRRAIAALSAGEVKIALFTSRAQVEHVFVLAADDKLADAFQQQLRRGVVGAVGPVCAEALRLEGIEPDVIPDHSKMGHLVQATAAIAAAVLKEKNNE